MTKSYILELVCKLLIARSVQSYTYRSLKADTGVTDMDHAIIQFHEIQPGMLGSKKFAGSSGASEDSTFFKDRLTKGEIVACVPHIDKDTGERTRKEFYVRANTVFQANTNVGEHEIEDAILDRFYLARFYEMTRDDKVRMRFADDPHSLCGDKTLFDVMGRQWNDLGQDMKSHLTKDFRRTQYLVALICKLMEIGVLPKVRIYPYRLVCLDPGRQTKGSLALR